jgi:hypothetical protein
MSNRRIASSPSSVSLSVRDTNIVKTPKRPRDMNQLAKLIGDLSTGEVQDADPNAGKNASAVQRGNRGGSKGGPARAAALPVLPDMLRSICAQLSLQSSASADACEHAELAAQLEIGGAIHASACSVHVFSMWRHGPNVLSQRRKSPRISNYTRGRRQGTSADNFPSCESRPQRGMPSASSDANRSAHGPAEAGHYDRPAEAGHYDRPAEPGHYTVTLARSR